MNTDDLNKLRQRFPFLAFDLEQILPRTRFVKEGAGVELFLQGAHVSRFDASHGGSPLFMSGATNYAAGKPLRGGVPLCFPWFGPKKDDVNAPAHGFARTSEWELTDANAKELTLSLQSSPRTLALWPHDFRADYRVGCDGEHLQLGLEVHNTGAAPLTFEAALHTYFRVSDVRNISISGLGGKTYLDKVENAARKTQKGLITIEGETDRVYLDSKGPILLRDGQRTVRIMDRGGWRSTIVWNPWIDKARALKDLGDDEWTQFVCIESGVVGDESVTVAAGESYTLAIEIEVASSL